MRRVLRGGVVLVVGSMMIAALAGCVPASHLVSVNGRTLLTHPSTGASADALGFGVLGTNPEGCVTMGESVLVVPDGSGLRADGSITVLGTSYKVGSGIKLGGGSGSAPTGSRCGSTSDYFWVG
ncbi:MAG: hypothetical protein JWQ39_2951 [Glaciihabitans sp.]|nr:hypothetical protein [Glaciihabitans sp.]